jgi:hypothetical protein
VKEREDMSVALPDHMYHRYCIAFLLLAPLEFRLPAVKPMKPYVDVKKIPKDNWEPL